jgi:hypothetical protein
MSPVANILSPLFHEQVENLNVFLLFALISAECRKFPSCSCLKKSEFTSLFERERNFTEGQLEVVEASVLPEQTDIFYMFSSDKLYKTV